MSKYVVIAILAKNKEKYLPLFLKCIESQTYDPKYIHIYIRTNNNTDKTENILSDWKDKVKDHYASIILINDNVKEKVERFSEHEWNEERFRVLAKIRQESVVYAINKNANYFVVDCDNFIVPSTLQDLIDSDKQVVAPILNHPSTLYSNFHHCITENGYYKNCSHYIPLVTKQNPGLHLCEVVHCTYFIKNEILNLINYSDGSSDYEYVIFSRICRKLNIEQYLDNRKSYGYLTLDDNDKCDIVNMENLMNDL